MKKTTLFLLILLLSVSISIVLVIFIYNSFNLRLKPSNNLELDKPIFSQEENLFFRYEIFRYASIVEITDTQVNESVINVGISTDQTNFNFGKIPRGSSSHKTVNLTNNGDEAYEMETLVFGNISNLININRRLTIEPQENKELPISMVANVDIPIGIYRGEIIFVTKIPKN